jgi:L-lactate dehydrogenase complex protein LldG
MSGRDAIFGKIRSALGANVGDPQRRASVDRRLTEHSRHVTPGRVAGKDATSLRQLFKSNMEAGLATVIEVDAEKDVPAAVAQYLRSQNLPQRIVTGGDPYLEGLPWKDQPGLTRTVGRAAPTDDVGVSHAVGGIAETGTLALASGPNNPVTLTFLPETHIVVVEASSIVGPYEDVWDRIRSAYGERAMPRTVNFVSGPSRTADIGGKIVIGAHGPRRLCVVLVGRTPA